MDFALSEDQQLLKKSAREFVEAEAPVSLARRMLEDASGFEPALWEHMARLGWMGVALPESAGGLGLGLLELSLILEEMARTATPSPFFSTVALAAPVAAAGADSGAVLAAVAEGSRRLTLALAGPSGRFGLDAVDVRAERADSWALTGRALFVPDAAVADQIVVVARDGAAIGIFLADASACRIEPQDSLDRSRRLASVTFEATPAQRLSGDDDASAGVERALDRAAVALAAEAVGVAEVALEHSVAYARERHQFGRPIGSFQAISHRCADMLIDVESARSTTLYAAWALDEGTPDAALAAATAKSAATTGAVRATQAAIQVHGGIGFTWEHDLHLYYRRALFCEKFLGDATVWRERIATFLGG